METNLSAIYNQVKSEFTPVLRTEVENVKATTKLDSQEGKDNDSFMDLVFKDGANVQKYELGGAGQQYEQTELLPSNVPGGKKNVFHAEYYNNGEYRNSFSFSTDYGEKQFGITRYVAAPNIDYLSTDNNNTAIYLRIYSENTSIFGSEKDISALVIDSQSSRVDKHGNLVVRVHDKDYLLDPPGLALLRDQLKRGDLPNGFEKYTPPADG